MKKPICAYDMTKQKYSIVLNSFSLCRKAQFRYLRFQFMKKKRDNNL